MPKSETVKFGGVTCDEWRSLVTFGTGTLSRILGCTRRYASDHAEDFGGVFIGRRWVFAKDKVARILGIEDAAAKESA